MTRLGRARATGETSETTILPTWLPTDPPLLLAAGFASDLVAFETFTPGAPPRWRFHTSGTVYGQPAYDSVHGRIYFGASDKRLYALDTRGLFLWSFETDGQSSHARPLVVGDLVVAASEDGTVYGLDAADRPRSAGPSGRRRDRVLAGPVGGTVVVGLGRRDVSRHRPVHRRAALDAQVPAAPSRPPIVADDDGGHGYVASRDGTLAAFKPCRLHR